jgi:hypothetical protein
MVAVAVALAVGVAVMVDSGKGSGSCGCGRAVGGKVGGEGSREGGGQVGHMGGGRGVLICDLLLIIVYFSHTLSHSYYLLLVSQPHPLRWCVFFCTYYRS